MLKIRGLRWWMISLVMLGSIINYLTRSALGVAAPTLMKDLHITEKQYSWIVGGFQGAIMFQPGCGYVMDTLGLKLGLAIFVLAWAFTNMAHGLAGSWLGLAGLRTLLGFSEGSANPAGMKAVAEWFPAKERGLAGGVYNIGASMGSLVAPPLVAWAIIAYNWRMSFVFTGALGLVWLLLWLLFYQSPEKHTALSDKEREYIRSGQEKHLQGSTARPSILQIARQRNFWGIALPRFLADPAWGTLTFWLPLYLMNVRGFDLKHLAIFGWLPFLGADLGCLFGGFLAIQFQKRMSLSVVNARRCAFTTGAVLMLGVGFAGFVKDPYAAVALLTLAGFAHQTLSVTVITMSSDLFKKSEVATVAGMAGTFGNAGLLIFSLLIGGLVTVVGYSPFFVCLGLLDVLGAIVLWTVVRERRPEEAQAN
jgi:MFS transporter, ACS family, hexuronate transporter